MKYIVILLAFGLVACNTSNKKNNMDSDYIISTSSESEERVKNILPLEGKEDVSNILSLDFREQKVLEEPEETEYFANEKYDWIITIESTNGTYFRRDSILKYFNSIWREKHQYPWLYCIPKGDSKWTFFNSSENESNEFTKVALGWRLYDPIEEPPTIYTKKALTKFRKSVAKIAEKLNSKPIHENYSVDRAASKSMELSEFVSENNFYSSIVLKADKRFEGKKIWDVMMSLGLKLGDMDIFHWNNNYGSGDDQLMSVWTSTNPGYFFPEEIAAGIVQTDDLIFGFSVPRSIAPREVLEVMYKATKYAQSRLGGQLLDENGLPFDISKERNKIEKTLVNLDNKSIKPGTTDALYLF